MVLASRLQRDWPSIMPDEALSSWFVRTSLMRGCDPLLLTGVLWPDRRIWTMDLDRGLSTEDLSFLSQKSGMPISHIERATLWPVASQITHNLTRRHRIWPWILVLGLRNRRRKGGWQYCIQCLKEDSTAYLRIYWRAAWHVGCEKHFVRLSDACPVCGMPIEVLRLQADDRTLTRCALCRNDLRDVMPESVRLSALLLQVEADRAIQNGFGQYDGVSIVSHEWFSLLRVFIQLFRKITLHKSFKLERALDALGIDVSRLQPLSTGLSFEFLETREREVLMAFTYQLLHLSRDRFIAVAQEYGLTRSTLWDNRIDIPLVLQQMEPKLELVSRKSHVRSFERGHPKSKITVKHKWARLQRKWRTKW